MPVTYDAVLSSVPGFHARPPVLALPPGSESTHDLSLSGPPPPDDGYDFILHVGVWINGGLKIEQLARKFGYYLADAEGKLAPVVSQGDDVPDDGDNTSVKEVSRAEAAMERFRAEIAGDLKSHLLNNEEDLGADESGNLLFVDGKARVVS